MQQVGSPTHTIALDIRPGHTPFQIVRANTTRVRKRAGRLLVLHRKLAARLLALLICAVLIAGIFQLRGGIAATLDSARSLISGEFAATGFGITEISITGQSLTRERDILAALELDSHSSTVSFDALAARERLLSMPSVAEVTIRKIYPDQLIVTLSERTPIARWRIDGVTFAIDQTGRQIAEGEMAVDSLPLVIGDGAGPAADAMVRAIQLYPDLSEGVVALSRIADRRWDMIYDTGLRVQLPETGVREALANLRAYQNEHRLLDRDLSVVDLRVAGTVTVRLVDRQVTETSESES